MRRVAGAACPPFEPYDADIVILSLDRPDETIAAVNSAFGQTDVRTHVAILDQGSTAANLERFAGTVASHPNATLLAVPCNLGVPAGRNRASAFGHGRIIVALDNDAVFATATTVRAAVSALDAQADLAAIGFRILLGETDADDPLSWGYPKSLRARAGGTFEAATFVGAGHAIRRAAWDEAGGYDEALFFCWEETDFALRAIRRGWRIEYRGNIAVRHMVAPERRLDWGGGRWRHHVRNRLYIAHKHGAGWPSLLALAGGYAVKGARNRLLRETMRAALAAAALSVQMRGERPTGPMREYLHRADRAHRHRFWRRIVSEALAPL